MDSSAVQRERAQNLWTSFSRKLEAVAHSTKLEPSPEFTLAEIGGLDGPKEELQTYACAATDPEVYSRWGTYPPSGLLLIGRSGVGKTLLARALASLTSTAFLKVAVPRLVIEVIHRGGKIGELMSGWSQVLSEMPRVTVLFEELEFSQAEEFGERRQDLPVGPVMDFLLDLVDRTIASERALVVGTTSHPETLRRAFHNPGRFERVVEVSPSFPGDVVAALEIHAAAAEKRAGHALFEPIDWLRVIGDHRDPSTGAWIRVMHATLRRKARCEAAGEEVALVSTADLHLEAERFIRASGRLSLPPGTYV